MAKLIFGCGYLGHRVARHWRAAGETVYAVTRVPARAAELAADGVQPLLGDVTDAATLAGLPAVETVLYAIAYDPRSGVSRRSATLEGLLAALDALPAVGRFIYVSSTSVFGAAGGAWVDETTACRPTREAGKTGLAAERLLAAHPWGERAIVLRLAGLYGPGRLPRLKDVLAGRPIEVAADAALNLIHVDDAAEVVLAAERRGRPPRTYLVSDGHPTDRLTFYRHLAALLGAAEPRFVLVAADQLRRGGDKRVSNARMAAELGVTLQYPSFREGLAAIAAEAS